MNIFANISAISSISSQDIAVRGSHRDRLPVLAATFDKFTIHLFLIPCVVHGLAPVPCPFKKNV